MAKKPRKKPAAVVAKATAKRSIPSIHLAHADELPQPFVNGVRGLERELDLSIVLLIQQGFEAPSGPQPFEMLDRAVVNGIASHARVVGKTKQIGLLIDSPGGYAREAYAIATILQRHCGGFTAIVPQYAKSAATLLTLGASRIVMHPDAELGPIDAQIVDTERERRASALDEFQSLERLHAQALNLVDSTMFLLVRRTPGKRTDVLVPIVLTYVAQIMRPLFEKIDTVHFTGMARTLKVAEAYASRLLTKKNPDHARDIAERLVYDYPDHGFVIDYDEALALGIGVEPMRGPVAALSELIRPHLNTFTAIGTIIEAPAHHGP